MDKENIREEWKQGRLLPPLVDIYESNDDFILVANMPGVKKDGIEVKLAEGNLTIYGRVEREEVASESFVLREINEGNYYRVFRVSDSIDVNKIKAKIEDGVLTLTLPKHERVKPREIPIEVA